MMKFEECMLEAVEALLLLGNTSPPDRPPDRPTASDNQPLPAHPIHQIAEPEKNADNALSLFAPMWGFRSTGSLYTGKSKRDQDEGISSLPVFPAPCSHRSPDTPLNGVADDDPSTSGSDVGLLACSFARPLKRPRACSAPKATIKANAVEGWPSGEAVFTSSQPAVRLSRKKTLAELQAEERLLLAERKELEMFLESVRIEKEGLTTENIRLLNALTRSEAAPFEPELKKSRFLLPDLNELVPAESLEQDLY